MKQNQKGVGAVDKEIAKRKLSDAKVELRQNETQYAKYQNFQPTRE